MNNKIKEVMTYGTVLNEVGSDNKEYDFKVRTVTYLYGNVVYFITLINGEVVNFTDTSKK